MFNNKNILHSLGFINLSKAKILGFFTLAGILAVLATAIIQTPTHAASLQLPESSDKKIQKLLLTRFLGFCIKNAPLSGGVLIENGARITGSGPANQGDWFQSKVGSIGPYMNDDRFGLSGGSNDAGYTRSVGYGDCGDDKTIKLALAALGKTGVEVLCKSGFARSDGSDGGTYEGCVAGNGDFKHANNSKMGSDASYNAFVKAYPEPTMNDSDWYWFYRKTFNWSCGYGKMDNPVTKAAAEGNRGFGYSLNYVTDVGPDYKETKYFIGLEKRDMTISTRLGEGGSGSAVNRTCEQIEAHIKSLGDKYATLITGDPSIITAPVAPDEETGSGTKNPTNCTIEGLGWIVCPIVTLFATATDALYGWISSYLKVQPLNADTSSSSNTLYIAWSIMRNIANVAFIIAFLIIVYSQLTGAGVSNYGVKKLLPRLVIAAILVNVSFWVSAVAVDISNIVGSSLYDILRHDVPLGDIVIEGNAWEALAATLLSGGAITGAAIGGAAAVSAGTLATLGPVALYAFIVFVLGVLLALLMAFIVLALRQAVIIILIVLSPLAFVAMLLPNTEKYFSTWRKALTTLLLFYPLFSILFGGSYLAGMIIIGSASTAGSDSATGMTVLIGMAVTVLPLWLTPLIVRFSTGVMGQVAGIVNNKGKGLVDRTRKVRDRKANLAMHETLGSTNAKARRNPFSRVYRKVQNSARTDAERNKVIESTNQVGYITSDVGKAMSYKSELANQKIEAGNAYNKVTFEESKSLSQAIPADKQLASQVQEARDTQQRIDIDHNRMSSAKTILQQELAEELHANPAMAAEAAGIDPRGESRVIAAATAVIADAEAKAISAEKSTMSRLMVSDPTGAEDLDRIMRNPAASAERRAAAAGQIMKVGSDKEIFDTLDYMSDVAGTPEGVTIQQQVQADGGPRKPISIGAMDWNALGRGEYSGDFDTKAGNRLLSGKVSVEKLHTTSTDELDRIIGVIPTLPAGHPELKELQKAIAEYKVSPTYRKPANEVVSRVDTIEGLL